MLSAGNERILIIAPHADDEVLGCGGLIEKACRYQNKVKVVVGAVGDTFFWHTQQPVAADIRKQELSQAMHYLGCDDYEVLYDDKESWMDTIPQRELITEIDHLLIGFQPTMVFIPYPSFHQDHQALFNACMAGLRPKPSSNIKLIAMFEYPFIIWQFPKITNVGELYLDISDTIDRKVEAFCKHQSQIRSDQSLLSPQVVKEWARFRGLEFGVPFAEKYHVLRAALL
ncbi:hypothetical protein E5161_02415 [Cohnella pontilimi]|uniref:PIG-L family deacetylase n=1 Tax=Cohnella pontilimi TaxID=2564100 RepID=A0A4U0FH38_9BACL|nr:PIG-L deacetylase family protein [Cohnella pontilimi]TJY44261.1 hypothetical protein E5161_02415 [Cohnella pontilimi]